MISRRHWRWPRWVWAMGWSVFGVSAQVALAAPATPASAPLQLPADPAPVSEAPLGTNAFKMVEPGVFELGLVRLDKRQRTVSFPAVLNLSEGPMEYFLVTAYGKTHESILRTDASPKQIHVAMLLLDAKGAGTNTLTGPPPSAVSNPSKEALPGDAVALEVHWNTGGKEITRRAEELVFNEATRTELGQGQWVYNGSALWEGTFLAQSEGSVVSLVTDPVALINNVGPGHDNDEIWAANTNKLPAANTPLRVTIKLEGARPRN